jgi:hypothetical protein
MSLKTKERCGKLANEAGIFVKTNYLALRCGNIPENKGS